jgi:hypothetical protein
MTPTLVVVEWWDAWADVDGFATIHGVHQTHRPMLIQTIGWLLQDDDTGVSLANEQSTEDGQQTWRGRTFVPRGMVQSVSPFKAERAKRAPRKPKVTEFSAIEALKECGQ